MTVQPNNVARLYTVQVVQKDSKEELIWEGRATNVVDAFTQARNAFDSKRLWTLFRCTVLDVRD